MRLWMACGTALLTVGCFSGQTALHPWLDEQEAVALPGIVGTWVGQGDDPVRMRITPLDADMSDGRPLYQLTLLGRDGTCTPGTFGLTLGHLDEALYWDMTALPLEGTDWTWDAHRLPLHSLARVDLEGNRLAVTFLAPEWVKAALAEGLLTTDHVVLEGDPLLTGETSDLQRLVLEHADDEGAFAKPAVFARRRAASLAD